MTHAYYKHCIAAVIVFDVTRPTTFDSVIKVLEKEVGRDRAGRMRLKCGVGLELSYSPLVPTSRAQPPPFSRPFFAPRAVEAGHQLQGGAGKRGAGADPAARKQGRHGRRDRGGHY